MNIIMSKFIIVNNNLINTDHIVKICRGYEMVGTGRKNRDWEANIHMINGNIICDPEISMENMEKIFEELQLILTGD